MWKKHKKNAMDVNKPLEVVRKKGSGRKRMISIEQLKAMVKEVPFSQRNKVRSLAKAIKIPKTTLHRALQIGVLQRSKSAVKPILTEQNKQARIEWVMSKVTQDGRFVNMMNDVHIDEKWFYITREKESYIIVEGESIPERKVKSKKFIAKIMFLAAFARPRVINEVTGEMWNGKIGIWPFVTTVIAKRTSVNRAAGTPETKSINVTSPTGVADATEEQIQAAAVAAAAAVARRLDIEEVRQDDSMITIEEGDDDEEPDEVAVEKDVANATSRITLLMKTFWANMDIETWNDDHGDYDHTAIEGAAELPHQMEEEEEPVMDGRMVDKNHHRQNLHQNLERPAAVQFGGGLLV
jgi:hypothetical protein